MAEFAKYAFNKSHAACYAAISMQTAYQKAHYPTEFFAGLLTSVMDDTSTLAKYIFNCKENGITIHEPDVNESDRVFKANMDGSVTYGLQSLKGVGESIISEIIANRNINGNYISISDMAHRNPSVTRKVIESLIYAGALDSFGYTRATLLANVDKLLQGNKKEIKNNVAGQMNLFEMFEPELAYRDILVEIPEVPRAELLKKEKETMGIYVSGHPFDEYQSMLASSIKKSSDFFFDEETEAKVSADEKVSVAGIITNIKKLYTKKDSKPMAAFELEDVFGSIRAVCFPKMYAELSAKIVEDTPVIISGHVTEDSNDGTLGISVQSIISIKDSPAQVWLRFTSMADYKAVADSLEEQFDDAYGKGEVVIKIVETNQMKVIKNVGKDIIPYLKERFGKENVAVRISA